MKINFRMTVFAAAMCAASGIGATTPISPGNVFHAGQTATLAIGASDDAWRVIDAIDEDIVVASGTALGSLLRLPHNSLDGKLGAYVLRSWRTGGTATNETRFAFLPPGDVRPCPWVGTQFHYWRDTWGTGDERILDLAAEAGIGIVREAPRWASCETSPGVYVMPPRYVTLVNGLVRRGMAPLCHLDYQNETAYPDDPFNATAFGNWAAWVADYFEGVIDTYEIWNEPHNFYFYEYYTNTVEVVSRTNPRWIQTFTDFTRTVDDALAGRGLRVCVASEDWSDILYTMIEQGIARPHNYLALHPYANGVRPERGKWLRDGFADLRNRLAENGAEGAGIAITEHGWSTYVDETGTADYAPATFAEQARYLVRMYLVANAGGAAFASQYDFKDDGTNRTKREHNWGMLDYWGRPKPSYAAIATMTRFVGDATFVEELSTDPASYRLQHFQRGGSTDIYVAWSVEGDQTVTIGDLRSVLRPTDNTCYDLYGNKISTPRTTNKLALTEDPVYLVKGASVSDDVDWGPPWAIVATSEPTTIFGNGRESLLWHTSPFQGTLRWEKPKGATSATLTIEGARYSRTWTSLTGESLAVELPGADGTAEDVYTMTLTFDNGTVQTAYIGAVTGNGADGTATAPHVRQSTSREWPRFQESAAIAIPSGARALTVNGAPLPGLDGSAGWRLLQSSRATSFDLSLSVAGAAEPLLATVRSTGGPLMLILK